MGGRHWLCVVESQHPSAALAAQLFRARDKCREPLLGSNDRGVNSLFDLPRANHPCKRRTISCRWRREREGEFEVSKNSRRFCRFCYASPADRCSIVDIDRRRECLPTSVVINAPVKLARAAVRPPLVLMTVEAKHAESIDLPTLSCPVKRFARDWVPGCR
jgi:hypothetical protein